MNLLKHSPAAASGKYLTFTATLTNAATAITGTAFSFLGSRDMNSGVIRPKVVGAGLRAFK